ncbi:hypothetical protein CTAYLR_005018 [Chrysophaeum taylorii]|uniref:RCC1-like domain-containing protein n=1 Tax=Chrysophaeum taylorii TaxID=2483200 RepID=A0AAD7UAX2_9STRA|nr:hypothetical protein CTAYLR_005018 [Chrysophaeum taylorii]
MLERLLGSQPELLAKLHQLEAAGISPRVVFSSALRKVRDERPRESRAEWGAKIERPALGRIAASLHSLIARRDGSCSALGYQPCGPAGQKEANLRLGEQAVCVAAGWGFSLVLTETGGVYAGGLDDECVPAANSGRQAAPRLERLRFPTRIFLISAGAAHALAVDEAGDAWSWGVGDDGRLGRPGGSAPARVKQLPDRCAAIAAGASHSLFATALGALYASGHGGSGRLGLGVELTDRRAPHRVDLEGVVYIAAGKYHSLAIDASGVVYAFGDNSYGQLGVGDDMDRLVPTVVDGSFARLGPKQVAAGAGHSLVLVANGDVWGFGNNARGQLGDHASFDGLREEKTRGLETRVLPRRTTTVGVKDLVVVVEQFDDDEEEERRREQSDDSSVVVVSATLNNDAEDLASDDGQTDDDDDVASEVWVPKRIPGLCGRSVVEVAAGSDAIDDEGHTLALTATGTILGLGSAQHGQIGPVARDQATTFGHLATTPRDILRGTAL